MQIEAGDLRWIAEEAGAGLWNAWDRSDNYLLGEYEGGLEFWAREGAVFDGWFVIVVLLSVDLEDHKRWFDSVTMWWTEFMLEHI